MSLTIDFQLASSTEDNLPTEAQFQSWVQTTLDKIPSSDDTRPIEVTIRIVDEDEIQELNRDYRGKDKTTNVLSFPFEEPVQLPSRLLGDLVICRQVVEAEAEQQNKHTLHHWAHLIIHGTLHLLGYDHIDDSDAVVMEQQEVEILNNLGIDDPYQDRE